MEQLSPKKLNLQILTRNLLKIGFCGILSLQMACGGNSDQPVRTLPLNNPPAPPPATPPTSSALTGSQTPSISSALTQQPLNRSGSGPLPRPGLRPLLALPGSYPVGPSSAPIDPPPLFSLFRDQSTHSTPGSHPSDLFRRRSGSSSNRSSRRSSVFSFLQSTNSLGRFLPPNTSAEAAAIRHSFLNDQVLLPVLGSENEDGMATQFNYGSLNLDDLAIGRSPLMLRNPYNHNVPLAPVIHQYHNFHYLGNTAPLVVSIPTEFYQYLPDELKGALSSQPINHLDLFFVPQVGEPGLVVPDSQGFSQTQIDDEARNLLQGNHALRNSLGIQAPTIAADSRAFFQQFDLQTLPSDTLAALRVEARTNLTRVLDPVIRSARAARGCLKPAFWIDPTLPLVDEEHIPDVRWTAQVPMAIYNSSENIDDAVRTNELREFTVLPHHGQISNDVGHLNLVANRNYSFTSFVVSPKFETSEDGRHLQPISNQTKGAVTLHWVMTREVYNQFLTALRANPSLSLQGLVTRLEQIEIFQRRENAHLLNSLKSMLGISATGRTTPASAPARTRTIITPPIVESSTEVAQEQPDQTETTLAPSNETSTSSTDSSTASQTDVPNPTSDSLSQPVPSAPHPVTPPRRNIRARQPISPLELGGTNVENISRLPLSRSRSLLLSDSDSVHSHLQARIDAIRIRMLADPVALVACQQAIQDLENLVQHNAELLEFTPSEEALPLLTSLILAPDQQDFSAVVNAVNDLSSWIATRLEQDEIEAGSPLRDAVSRLLLPSFKMVYLRIYELLVLQTPSDLLPQIPEFTEDNSSININDAITFAVALGIRASEQDLRSLNAQFTEHGEGIILPAESNWPIATSLQARAAYGLNYLTNLWIRGRILTDEIRLIQQANEDENASGILPTPEINRIFTATLQNPELEYEHIEIDYAPLAIEADSLRTTLTQEVAPLRAEQTELTLSNTLLGLSLESYESLPVDLLRSSIQEVRSALSAERQARQDEADRIRAESERAANLLRGRIELALDREPGTLLETTDEELLNLLRQEVARQQRIDLTNTSNPRVVALFERSMERLLQNIERERAQQQRQNSAQRTPSPAQILSEVETE